VKQNQGRKYKQSNRQLLQQPGSYLLPRLFTLIIFILFIVSAWLSVDWLYKPGNFPIKQVKLENKLNNQEAKELQRVASQAVNGGFFSLDISQFRTELLQNLPWLKEVSVRKVWPDSVLVSIKEHQPVGRWISIENRTKGENELYDKIELLSRNGIIFFPELSDKQRTKFNGLAILTGPKLSTNNILETCFKINADLKRLKSRLKKCGMNERRSWLITLDNGLDIKLGKENVMQNLAQYIDVFSVQLAKYFNQVEYADLRFANGFSIKWKVQTNESAN
jgi:cell division protein FtsQ